MTDTDPQIRAIATQLIRNAVKGIDSEVACDHVVATLGEDVDVDALAFGSEAAVRKARIDISWDSDPASECPAAVVPVPPTDPTAETPREQLLAAIDGTRVPPLGYGSPEELLAAYDAARTSTTDPAVLRDRIAEALLDHLSRTADIRTGRGGDLAFTPEITDAERMRLTDAVLAVLPAPVDRAAVLREVERHVRDLAQATFQPYYRSAYATLADDISRMADETAATETHPQHRPVALATPCTACGHTYNWHTRRDHQCEAVPLGVGRCGCTGFVPGERPEPVDPQRILGAHQPAAGVRQADETADAETDEERADREETARDHARGAHTHCGITCEVELPTEHLRNFVVAKGYPGTKGALAELERRAAAGARRNGAS